MRIRERAVHAALASVLLLAQCAPPEPTAGAPGGTIVGDELLGMPRHSRPLQQALGPDGRHIIFLNFDGVTLSPNYDDAVHNQSSIAASVNHQIVVPAFNEKDFSTSKTRTQVIADIVALAKKYYADFNAEIVTVRPTSPDYVMTAIGGLPDLIDQPCQGGGCVAGLAPLDCQMNGKGGIEYNSQGDVEVVFAFTATTGYFNQQVGQVPYADAIQSAAVTIAQETAHAYGLGHESNTNDVMYPQETGTTQGFLNVASSYADSFNCANGSGTQNSHALLLQILGAPIGGMMTMPTTDTTPPTIQVTTPASGSTVEMLTINISVAASDDVGVDHIDLALNGPDVEQTTLTGAARTWSLSLTDAGSYTVTATAYDAAGNSAVATSTFQVTDGGAVNPNLLGFGASCGTGSQCVSGLCRAGICTKTCGTCPNGYRCNASFVCEVGNPVKMDPTTGSDGGTTTTGPTGTVGQTCAGASDCASGVCASAASSQYCTAMCDPNVAGSCPSNMACTNLGSDGYWCTVNTAKGCSCAVGGASAGSTSSAALWLALLPLLLVRRRRAA